MPNFSYVARNKAGQIKKGEMFSSDRASLVAKLKSEGFPLVSVKEAAVESKIRKSSFSFFKKVSLLDKIMFAKHLSVMIKAGIPISRALKILSAQSSNPAFSDIIKDIAENINKGKSFADSLRVHENIFGELFINMIAVGEVSGNLEKVLGVLMEQMRKDYELMSRVKGAMMYPAVIITAMFFIGVAMMTFVVPKLMSVFVEMNIDLPASTKLVLQLTNIFKDYGVMMLLAVPVLGVAAGFILKKKSGQDFLDKVIMKLPVVGEVSRKINQARFARTLGSLITSGVPIVEGLNITSNTLTNHFFKDSLRLTAKQVEKGKPLGETLGGFSNIYAPLVTEMITIGEETGALDSILEDIAGFYENEVDEATKNLSTIIEPVLMIVLGTAVGFFAVAMIQPMSSLSSSI